MKIKEVAVLLKKISLYFPNQVDFPSGSKEQDKALKRIWLEQLKPFPADDVWRAIKSVIFKEPNYVPNPIKVVKEIQEMHSDNLSAGEAWSKVVSHIERGYLESDGNELPPLAKEALNRIGGKKNLEGNQDNIGYMKEFKDTYRRLVEEKREEQVRKKISGETMPLLEGEDE